jgi:hypothetical protein
MAKDKENFHKKSAIRNLSKIGSIGRNRAKERLSLARSMGKARTGQETSPIVAIQQVHLYKKQKEFLAKLGDTFERKGADLKEQVKAFDSKIKESTKIALDMIKDLEVDLETSATIDESLEEGKEATKKSASEKKKGKTGKFFKLGY